MAKGYKNKSRYNRTKYRRKKYLSQKAALYTKAIDSQVERRMVEIAQALDSKDEWIVSRIDHLKDGAAYPGTHAKPTITNMVNPDHNSLWYQDISQFTQSPTDLELSIKTVQSRLRFYTSSHVPITIRVAIIKITNSGRYGSNSSLGVINQDIFPNFTMIGDTNLRYSGIHNKELKAQAPGTYGQVTVAQQKFTIYPGSDIGGSNSESGPASSQREIILTKTYKNFAKQIITQIQTQADHILTVPGQNQNKIIGDRFWLLVQGDSQYSSSTNASDGSFSFYGSSGMIYKVDTAAAAQSVPLTDANEIKSGNP